jgi:hypothetical protein
MYNPAMPLTHYQNRAKYERCFAELQRLTDIRTKSTMWKFYNVMRKYWTEMDNEMVECRKRGKFTTRYQELEVKFTESITVFDQHMLIACLMYV